MSTLKISNPRLPLGSTVLVTGVNGLIASQLADQLIQAEYRVRGSVRSVSKYAWLDSFFSDRYGPDKFSLVEVTDMRVPGCFDNAAKDVSGIAHTATYMDFTTQNPNDVIPPVLQSITTALEAAKKSTSVKAFVLTSSSWATKSAESNVEEAPTTIYSASKVAAEQALWKWAKENNPKFVVNAVLPSTTTGGILNPEKQGIPSTAGFVQMFYNAQKTEDVQFPMSFVKPGWYIDVGDVAKLRIAGLVDPGVTNERLYGFAGDFTWDDVLAIFRELDPKRTFLKDFGMERDKVDIRPRGRAEEVLKECFGVGFTGLKETITANIESFTKHQVKSGAGWVSTT
ncbi:NAD(P)-binding protein [Mytilinidion resinicola]|uniref:NAD(P)-binding protein n=1 Tax=Mytilinidion resinicola TaxID=574789 RepID=A0A6A6Z0N3_9PEZI|nr:NAD(P)-binding protein [Mytilinidion resinicola]KAF2814263.1 NAD(P)-binding protein [Mytilinidion resinicola]